MQDFFVRHGGKLVVVARFIEGLRQFGGIIAGASEMSWARFRMFNIIGAALWVLVWGGLGYAAGTHLEAITRLVARSGAYLALSVVMLLGVTVAIHVVRHRSRHGAVIQPDKSGSR